MELRETARKWALKNAFDHGKAQANALVGKVIGEFPEAKKDIQALKKMLDEVAEEVNSLSKEELEKEVSGFVFEEKKQREDLPEIKIKQANTRVAPNPSGFLHIGHAKAFVLCDEYAKRYKGQLILRLEDTDPKIKKPLPEAYDAIPEDAKWLGCNIAKKVIQSERLPIYYKHAEELIKKGHAYVCSCAATELQKNRADGKECGCRKQTPGQALREWHGMLLSTKEGRAVLRIKTDMQHPNASVRDWPAMRIVVADHPRVGKKFRVWPLYNFSCALDDHLLGITLVLRGKEHEMNAEKQKYIYDYFGWTEPMFLEYGLLKVEGAMAHKSDIIKGIKEGRFSGWDDVRLPTLRALRKRGIQPEAIRKYMISLGVKPTDSMLDWDILYKMNKQLLQGSDHYYFVAEPVELETGLEEKIVELQKNPEEKRVVAVKSKVFISKKDFDEFEGKTVRLKDLANVELPSGKLSRNQTDHSFPKVQWVCEPAVKVKVLKPDGSIEEGLAEEGVGKLKEGSVVQFERYGFCRFDRDEDGFRIFYYAHA